MAKFESKNPINHHRKKERIMSRVKQDNRKSFKCTVKETEAGSRFTWTESHHGNMTLTGLNALREHSALGGISIKVGGMQIRAHRNVLAVNSDYFLAMFTGGMEESRCEEITMEGVDGESLASLVEYMYTGTLSVLADQMQDLLIAADLLQMNAVKELCQEKMVSYITEANCLGMLQFGQHYQCPNLSHKALLLAKKCFVVVCQTEEFLSLTPEALIQLIRHDDLSLGNSHLAGQEREDCVVNAVMTWLTYDTQARLKYFSDVLPHVRWKWASENCYQQIINNDIFNQEAAIKTLVEYERSHSSLHWRVATPTVYAIGGYLQSRTGPACPRLKTVECYSGTSQTWDTVACLPIIASSVFAFNVDGKVICLTLEGCSLLTPHMYEYSIVQDKWTDITGNISTQCQVTLLAALEGDSAFTFCSQTKNLYTLYSENRKHAQSHFCVIKVRNTDGDVYLDTKTSLQPVAWSQDMEGTWVTNYALVLHKGQLYCLGGLSSLSELEREPRNEVYVYQEQENTWRQLASMLSPRTALAAVSLGDHIYAIGGYSSVRLRTVERYNPTEDKWESLPGMARPRSFHSAVTIGDSILVVGGKSYALRFQCGGARKVLRECEIYHPIPNVWEEAAPMSEARCLLAMVTL